MRVIGDRLEVRKGGEGESEGESEAVKTPEWP